MPILGKSGESITQRLFGKSILPGTGVKNMLSHTGTNPIAMAGYVANRVAKGAATPGGALTIPSRSFTVKNTNQNNYSSAPQQSFVTPAPDQRQEQQAQSSGIQVLPTVSGGSASAYRTNQTLRDKIGRDWSNVGDSMSETSGALKKMGMSIGDLKGARNDYLTANDENLQKKRDAIAGNRTLIQRNQGNSMHDLAENVRSKIFSSNIGLGASAGSSASEAIARALQKSAGKDRANILTQYGDQISEQNQNEGDAMETHKMQREKAYQWEESETKKATEEFKQQKAVLDRLKKMVPDWKRQDIEDEGNARLQELLSNISAIKAQARSFRDNLYSLRDGMRNESEAVRAANIGINAPSELDTPNFDPNIDLTGLDGEDNTDESFYNPDVKFKKRVSKDILDNPLIFE